MMVGRAGVEGRRIDRHNESPSAIPQQKEDVVPPAMDRAAHSRSARNTAPLHQSKNG